MADITIRATGPSTYAATIDDTGTRTQHEVVVPARLVDRLCWPPPHLVAWSNT